jgi:serine/threonine protein kinase
MTIIANRYEVLEQLGAGGMGTVWLVRDKLRNQKVALKRILMSDADQRLAEGYILYLMGSRDKTR